MSRFVITPDVALRLAEVRRDVAPGLELLAPTLFRSQVLSLLHRAVHDGDLEAAEAEAQLEHVRGVSMRLLGDRVLQRVAWQVADRFGWPDTYEAEYVALTKLQADALVTLDDQLALRAGELVKVATFDEVFGKPGRGG